MSDWEEVSEWEEVPDSPPASGPAQWRHQPLPDAPPYQLDRNEPSDAGFYDQGPPTSAAGSKGETSLREMKDKWVNIGAGAAQGWMPQIAGAFGAVGQTLAEPIGKALGASPLDNKSILERYREARDSARNYYSQSERDNPEDASTSHMIGNIAGGSAMAAKLFPNASGAISGAILGGTNALGSSKADLTKGEFVDAAIPTIAGAALGAITGKAMDMASSGAGAIVDGVRGSAKVALGRILQKPENLINKFKKATTPASTGTGSQATQAMEKQAMEATLRIPLDVPRGGPGETGQIMQKELGELAKLGDPESSLRAAVRYGDDEVQAAAARSEDFRAQLAAENKAKQDAAQQAFGKQKTGKLNIRSGEPQTAMSTKPRPSESPVRRQEIMDEVAGHAARREAASKFPEPLSPSEVALRPAAQPFPEPNEALIRESFPAPVDMSAPRTPDIGDYTNRSTIFNRLSKDKQAAIKMDNAGSDPMFWTRSDEALTGAPRSKDMPINDKWTADFPEPNFLGTEHKPMGQDSAQFMLDQIMNPQHDKTALLSAEEMQRQLWLQKLQNQRGFIDPGAIAEGVMGGFGAYAGIKGAIKAAPAMGTIGRNLETAGRSELRANAMKAAQNPAHLRYWANQEGPLGNAARWALSGDAKGLAARTFVLSLQPQFQQLLNGDSTQQTSDPAR